MTHSSGERFHNFQDINRAVTAARRDDGIKPVLAMRQVVVEDSRTVVGCVVSPPERLSWRSC